MRPVDAAPDRSLRFAVAGNFVLAAVLSILASVGTLGQVLRGEMINPDSYMRLVRLHDELAAGHTLEAVARDGSGHGTILAWSHLLDSLVVLLAVPFGLLSDPDTAMRLAGIMAGPLSIGALGAALAWAVAPVADRCFLWSAAAACALAPMILGYGMVGVLHHHVLLAVVTTMTAGWALRLALGQGGAAAGIAMGAWVATGIWLSPETLPFRLLAFGGVALAWLLAPQTPGLRAGIAAAGTALLGVVVAALLVDAPPGGFFTTEIDRLSGVYLALGVACCAAGWALTRLGRTAGATLAVACVVAWVAANPSLLRGAEAVVTPEQARAMLAHILEMEPVHGALDVVAYLGGGLVATGLLGWLTWRRHSALLAYMVLCGAFIVVQGALHVRFSTYAATLAGALLPVALTLATRSLGERGMRLLVPVRAGLIVCAVLLPWLAMLLPGHARATSQTRGMECHTLAGAALLAPYAGRIVLSEPNDTPELLYRSGVLTVGSLYHRNAAAFMRLRAAWRSKPVTVPDAAVVATGATLFLVCPRAERSPRVADLPPDTLLDKLWAGEVPPWLHRVGAEPSGYVLYERVP